MEYCVYVLFSVLHKKHYTGYTSDLDGRLLSHNELGKGWTSRYRPWKLIYLETFSQQSEAIAREKWLKSGVGRSFIQSLKH
ncbi:GIY-YIG nuclease family protein [Flavihumibacter sp. RY-1]|uniref:GIY-YIG nuclease family protein n=1 Tax=Flavihumibacter fluminis TaxID=2909236 RepID=A0ABS9BEZ0_9BACT|nr:GIY-YIG nuclease family protein [Flavihumibacter fluminis]MCF1713875.1 GIY-YIG nuclease family protein [Flavihumibacter fluminis]